MTDAERIAELEARIKRLEQTKTTTTTETRTRFVRSPEFKENFDSIFKKFDSVFDEFGKLMKKAFE